MDRRRFLALGTFGAGAFFAGPAPRRPDRADAWFCALRGDVAAATPRSSPPIEAFTRAFAVPPVAVPTSGVTAGDGVDRYEFEVRPGTVSILPDRPTPILGFDGVFPGPTIVARSGRRVEVDVANALSGPIAVHLHGAHTAPEDDGHPLDAVAPGTTRRYHYPNGQDHATLWYHDHVMHDTAENVYRGLAGLYLLHDDVEDAAGLPTGDFDLPLLLQDRLLDDDGVLVYPAGSPARDGVLGDVFLVNGVPQPRLEVERRPYRFRIVNGSNARPYSVVLDGRSLLQVGGDGGLLAAPVPVASLGLGIAERAEVVIDFSTFDAGDQVVLRDDISGTGLVRFDVAGGPSSAPALPSTLRTIEPLPTPTVDREVRLGFDDALGQWVLDGRAFDPHRIDQRVRAGEVERWSIVNESSFEHPFHLHLAMFQVTKRGLVDPPPGERGWKDTVRVRAGETVQLTTRFTGFPGNFLYHCHILEHEDHSMMAQLRVVDVVRRAGVDRYGTAAALSAATFPDGAPVAHVASGTVFADALAGGPAAAATSGPILLTRADALPDATRAELVRLRPDRIVVLGGPSSVGEGVVTALAAIAPVQRLHGANRYDTAAAVATATFPTGAPVAYVATGRSFPDALAGGAAAAHEGGPMLLTPPDGLPPTVVEALEHLRPQSIRVLGGSGAVGADVERELASLAGAGGVARIAGADRFGTAAAVARTVFAEAPTVFVATGANFPDALAAVPAAAAAGAPLLLARHDELPEVTRAECARLATARAVVLGGTQVLDPAVERQLVETC